MKVTRKLGLVAALGLAFAAAQGQDTPPETQDKEQETPATPQEEPKEQEEAPVRRRSLLVTYDLGVYGWNIDGNENKFRQYASPVKGFDLSQLRLEPWNVGGATYGLFDLRGVGSDDYLAYGKASFFYGDTRIEGYIRNSTFFEPAPAVLDESERSVREVSVRQAIGQNVSASYQFRADQKDYLYAPPRLETHGRTYLNNVALEGSVLGGFASASYTDLRHYDRTNVWPDTQARVMSLNYGAGISPNTGPSSTAGYQTEVGINGALSRTEIEPSAGQLNRVDTASFGGSLQLGYNSNLGLEVGRQWLDLPTVRSAKVNQRDFARVRLSHRFGNGWGAQVGYRTVQVERERADHTYVDAPRWNTFEGRLTGKLMDDVRLTLRGYLQNVNGHAVMSTQDIRPLYYNKRSYLQARVEAGRDLWSGYASFTAYNADNESRDVTIRTNNFTIGGSYQVLPNLGIYAEHSIDRNSADSSEVQSPDLGSFFPDGRTNVIGLSWAPTQDLFLTLDYTDFATDNDNPWFEPQGNVRGRFLNSTLRYRTKAGFDIDLTFAPWRFRDRLYDAWSYDATVFGISARGRF